jgi:uncharacterized membrane protein YkoI
LPETAGRPHQAHWQIVWFWSNCRNRRGRILLPIDEAPASSRGLEEKIMNRTRLFTLVTVSVLTTGALGVADAAYARDNDRRTNEAAVIANAKVSMAQAIATAEQQTGGKAVDTGIEEQNGAMYLEVQVLKDGQKHSVLIDPQSGQVVKIALDNEQDENGDDEDDD